MKRYWSILGFVMGVFWRVAAAEPWTLEHAVRHALTNSPDARLAAHRIAAAQAGLDQARAAFSPQLQLQSVLVRQSELPPSHLLLPLLLFATHRQTHLFCLCFLFFDP